MAASIATFWGGRMLRTSGTPKQLIQVVGPRVPSAQSLGGAGHRTEVGRQPPAHLNALFEQFSYLRREIDDPRLILVPFFFSSSTFGKQMMSGISCATVIYKSVAAWTRCAFVHS